MNNSFNLSNNSSLLNTLNTSFTTIQGSVHNPSTGQTESGANPINRNFTTFPSNFRRTCILNTEKDVYGLCNEQIPNEFSPTPIPWWQMSVELPRPRDRFSSDTKAAASSQSAQVLPPIHPEVEAYINERLKQRLQNLCDQAHTPEQKTIVRNFLQKFERNLNLQCSKGTEVHLSHKQNLQEQARELCERLSRFEAGILTYGLINNTVDKLKACERKIHEDSLRRERIEYAALKVLFNKVHLVENNDHLEDPLEVIKENSPFPLDVCLSNILNMSEEGSQKMADHLLEYATACLSQYLPDLSQIKRAPNSHQTYKELLKEQMEYFKQQVFLNPSIEIAEKYGLSRYLDKLNKAYGPQPEIIQNLQRKLTAHLLTRLANVLPYCSETPYSAHTSDNERSDVIDAQQKLTAVQPGKNPDSVGNILYGILVPSRSLLESLESNYGVSSPNSEECGKLMKELQDAYVDYYGPVSNWPLWNPGSFLAHPADYSN